MTDLRLFDLPGHDGWLYGIVMGPHLKIGYSISTRRPRKDYRKFGGIPLFIVSGSLTEERAFHEQHLHDRVAMEGALLTRETYHVTASVCDSVRTWMEDSNRELHHLHHEYRTLMARMVRADGWAADELNNGTGPV